MTARGFVITGEIGKARSIARKSCFEEVLGGLSDVPARSRPILTSTPSMSPKKAVVEARVRAATLGENIFHRPASSGTVQYAVVSHTMDLYKVGRNDITLAYDLDDPAPSRKKRVAALLRGVLQRVRRAKITGAPHRNISESPHVVDFEGVITTSTSTLPAPALRVCVEQGLCGRTRPDRYAALNGLKVLRTTTS